MRETLRLAEEVAKLVGDVDSNTAYTALEIAKLLLVHRDSALRGTSSTTSLLSYLTEVASKASVAES